MQGLVSTLEDAVPLAAVPFSLRARCLAAQLASRLPRSEVIAQGILPPAPLGGPARGGLLGDGGGEGGEEEAAGQMQLEEAVALALLQARVRMRAVWSEESRVAPDAARAGGRVSGQSAD